MAKRDVGSMILFLDAYMRREGRTSLSAVEAAMALDRADLLADRLDRPGLPLRDLLRAGKFPHAYQVRGKHTAWVIPLSHELERDDKLG